MSDSKQVTFSELTIHEHPLELGDHPSCSKGAPLTIGWESQSSATRNLELYEYMRGERRRGRKQLVMSVQKRGQILLEAGYSLNEIGNAALQVDVIKKQRADTLKNQGWDRAHLILERTGKLPKGIMNGVNALVKPIQNSVQARTA
jgi:hypothetical protein